MSRPGLKAASEPVDVHAIGLVTPVGLTAAAAAAALRAGISRVGEIPFHDSGGNAIVAATVRQVAEGRQGLRRLVEMLAAALRDTAMRLDGLLPRGLPLLVGVAERDRPGRPKGLDGDLLPSLERVSGVAFDRRWSDLLPHGNTAVLRALARARELLADGSAEAVLVAGADSWLNGPSLEFLESEGRLKTEVDPDGVIPSEGAGVLVVTRAGAVDGRRTALQLAGLGFAREEAAARPEAPMVGVGLAAAARAALEDAGATSSETHFRISDVAGTRREFTDTSYALARTLREVHPSHPLWAPAESFGEMGAATGVALLAVAAAAWAKGYAPGEGGLCQSSTPSGDRAVAFVRPPVG